jgi:riboflavin biosynthesis pyrimidine reductase
VEILLLPSRGQDGADLPGLLDALGKRQVASVLIEGGSKVITSVLKTGLAHRVVAVLSPKITGKVSPL